MREIKFRGKRIDNGDWVYGNLIIHITEQGEGVSHYFIEEIPSHWNTETKEHFWEHRRWKVIPETVGQFTGLKDKNGKENFHKDILDWDGNRFVIEWDDDNGMWYGRPVMGNKERGALVGLAFGNATNVGNIHENPELMEVKEQ